MHVPYAHTLAGQPPEKWEPLERHLKEVARLAGDFAAAFRAQEWGAALGRWHDLGKYSDVFQEYLLRTVDPDAGEEDPNAGEKRSLGRVDHSTFGAQHAAKVVGGHAGQILAFCIAGHHAGLPDATSDDETTRRATLEARLALGPPRVPPVDLPHAEVAAPNVKLPFALSSEDRGFQVAFFTRILFSCLIDADRIATEAFCDAAQSAKRSMPKPSMVQLSAALDAFLARKQKEVEATAVNRVRASVLAECLTAAPLAPGFFSLNVPTGGGKTFSSLAFALHHANSHDLRRVVIAIPFTSIIEQTADEYRRALGKLAQHGLVEHHSNIEPKNNTRRNQIAVENWDAPLIVTTNVQLYESLFAAATTPCRKLHRLVRSVIVLDEAQTLPVEVLRPTLAALKELVDHYGCSVVLCTATQPALEKREQFDIGFENVRQVVRDVPALFVALERVKVTRLGTLTDDELGERLASEPAVLCIVNSRPHAANLYEALIAQGRNHCYHLSTLMCAQHRRDVLAQIRRHLKENAPCRVVSTQLIEAGVDIDFPVVYRAPAGFDSIAQAAGRCNREGRLPQGLVFLFEAESLPPIGMLRNAAQTARELMPSFPHPIAPDAIEAYFRQFCWSQSHRWDKHDVLGPLTDNLGQPQLLLKFRTAASNYRIIDKNQESILVPYDETARRVRDRLVGGESDFALLRAAQRYLVGVYENDLNAFLARGLVMPNDSGVFLLVNEAAYSSEKGLSLSGVGMDADLLIQ